MDSNSGGAGQGKEEKWDRDEWRIEESWEYTVTEIWELGIPMIPILINYPN